MTGKVGPFFYKNGKILADGVDICHAEKYGEFRTWGDHSVFWDNLSIKHHEYSQIEYFTCPRGRVTYNFNLNRFYIYLNKEINNKKIISLIVKECNLIELDYIIDDTDEHYQIRS